MDRLTLREAAERTYRSITTLRRYIRSGRLHAEKRYGRFGPEYFVSEKDLASAGLTTHPRSATSRALATRPGDRDQLASPGIPADSVPITLYQELQMKHEQLLVQYGMVRAGGLRVLELQAELQTRQREIQNGREQVARLTDRSQREVSRLKQSLREAQLELEGRALEISALREKVKALEMLTRNAATNETIEKQFSAVQGQVRRIRQLDRTASDRKPVWPSPGEVKRTDH